jgi:hypothetical protein
VLPKSNNNQPQPSSYKLVAPPPLESFTPEWALFRFLQPWTPEDMQIAIKKDVALDLSAYMNLIEKYVTDELLDKFKIYRPDLYTILSKQEGKAWLKRKIRQAMTQR